MKRDQQRVRTVLADTITLLCRNGLTFQNELRIQGVIGITIDEHDTFIVHINETFQELPEPLSSCVDDTTPIKESTGSDAEPSKDPVDASKISTVRSTKRERSDTEYINQQKIKVARRSSFTSNNTESVSLDGFTSHREASSGLRKSMSESGRTRNKFNKQSSPRKTSSLSVDASCAISTEEEENETNAAVVIEEMINLVEDNSELLIVGRTVSNSEDVAIKPEEGVTTVVPKSPKDCYVRGNILATKSKAIDPLSASSDEDVINHAVRDVGEFSFSDEKFSTSSMFESELHRIKREKSEYFDDQIDLVDVDASESTDCGRAGAYAYHESYSADDNVWVEDESRKLQKGWTVSDSFDYGDPNESNSQDWRENSRQRRGLTSTSSLQSQQLHTIHSRFSNSTANSFRRHGWGRTPTSVTTGPRFESSPIGYAGRGPEDGGGGPGYEVMSRYVCSVAGCGTSFSNKQNLQRHQTHKHGREKTYRNRFPYF